MSSATGIWCAGAGGVWCGLLAIATLLAAIMAPNWALTREPILLPEPIASQIELGGSSSWEHKEGHKFTALKYELNSIVKSRVSRSVNVQEAEDIINGNTSPISTDKTVNVKLFLEPTYISNSKRFDNINTKVNDSSQDQIHKISTFSKSDTSSIRVSNTMLHSKREKISYKSSYSPSLAYLRLSTLRPIHQQTKSASVVEYPFPNYDNPLPYDTKISSDTFDSDAALYANGRKYTNSLLLNQHADKPLSSYEPTKSNYEITLQGHHDYSYQSNSNHDNQASFKIV